MVDLMPLLFSALAFSAVAAVTFVLGQHFALRAQMERRLPVWPRSDGEADGLPLHGVYRLVGRVFPNNWLEARRDQARHELLRSGFFNHDAVDVYLFVRMMLIAVVPPAVLLATQFFPAGTPAAVSALLLALSTFIAIMGPGAFLSRRHRALVRQYRLVFPDFLDLLVVCVDAGLTLDGAFGRIRGEIGKRSRALGKNLELMSAEMGAGRSMIEALVSLADRLDLDEAASFVSMLRQCVELGSDISEALRVFSDEMRDKRLLRAEEAANRLSVKMVLPLGLFIFPVVLLVIMLPVILKLMSVLK